MKYKVTSWVKRYLPAEILSTIVTVTAASLTFKFTSNSLSTALVGTWAGNIAYFGYILTGDVLLKLKKCRNENSAYTNSDTWHNLKLLAVEFGVAEIFDSFLIRPALLYYMPLWIGQLSLGIFIAEIAANITFYIPAIIGYELRLRHLK